MSSYILEMTELDRLDKFAQILVDTNRIIDINIIVPEKVIEVVFANHHKEKMILQEPDVFDIEKCLYIALAKKLYRNVCTYEGIEHAAEEMRNFKYYAKIVKSGVKLYKDILFEQEYFEKSAKEEAERIERKKAKRAKYKARRAEKLVTLEVEKRKAEEERQIEIQKEAYIRAMKEMNQNKGE